MNILGISGGRHMGNSEILVKEALMGAEETGATVEFVRLADLNVRPLLGEPGPTEQPDDGALLRKKMTECDGIILGAPVYCLTAPGFMTSIRDRVSIRHSVRETPQIGGMIAVGGTDWVGLALPTMYLFLPHGHVKIVDQFVLPHTSYLRQVILNKDAIARARKLGRTVAGATHHPESAGYEGDEYWTCPLCRQNLLKIKGTQVECLICDIRGKITIEGDSISVEFSEEDLQTYRWGRKGLERHDGLLKTNNTIDREGMAAHKEALNKYERYSPNGS